MNGLNLLGDFIGEHSPLISQLESSKTCGLGLICDTIEKSTSISSNRINDLKTTTPFNGLHLLADIVGEHLSVISQLESSKICDLSLICDAIQESNSFVSNSRKIYVEKNIYKHHHNSHNKLKNLQKRFCSK